MTDEEKKFGLEVGTIPNQRDDAKSTQTPAGPARKKILVVDDSEEIRSLYTDVLKNNNFDVSEAPDGLDALRKMKAGNIPDLVFTGILMPTMGGFDLIREMRKDGRLLQIPIIVNSHRGLPEDQKMAEELGVKDFIIFGFTPPIEVVERIKSALGLQTIFKVVIPLERPDAKKLVDLLKKKQKIDLPEDAKEAELEIRETENGEFSLKLISNR